MYYLDCEFLITNYFAETEKDSLSLKQLNKLKTEIEKELKKDNISVFIDISSESLNNFIDSNLQYFKFKETLILFNRKKINLFYEDLYSIFNSKIEKEIKYQLLDKLIKNLN